MFIVGVNSKVKIHQEGQFFCPICDRNQPYKHVKIKEIGSIMFLPIIPMGTTSEYIECAGCHGNYMPGFEQAQEENELDSECPMATSHRGMIRVLVFLLLGYGKTSERIKAVQSIYQDLTGQSVSQDCLNSEMQYILQSSDDLLGVARQIAPAMSFEHKANIVLAAHKFTDACSDMEYEDKLRLNQLSSCFGIRLPT